MAKDDYDVIAYKILLYLYGCMKRVILFDQAVFDKSIKREELNEGYFVDILRMMQKEELIDGVTTTTPWGNEHILLSDIADIEITAEGIRYLKENSRAQKVKDFLKESVDIFSSLIGLLKV